jgi:protocatechuate 3,4-dioxygenase beta subunit
MLHFHLCYAYNKWESRMKRRTILKGLAAIAPITASGKLLADESNFARGVGSCRLISQDILGPFAIEQPPMRSDLALDQPGVPLKLRLQILNAFSCQPLPGARVSIWHSNADGFYSAVENIVLNGDGQPTGETYDTRDRDWLRGAQVSDEQGMVAFNTIVPGWYFPRPTHIHVQVFPPTPGEVATTQFYIPDAVCDQIYTAEPYAKRGPNKVRTDPSADSPIDGSDEGDLWLNLKPNGDGLVADHTIGVTFYGDQFGELPDLYKQS